MNKSKTTSLVCAVFAVVLLAALPLPRNPDYLLGRSPDDVIALFGVPSDASAGHAVMHFTYDAPDGGTGVFVFHQGVAVQVPAKDFKPAKIKRPSPQEAYAGQNIASAVAVLGNATDVTQGSNSATLRYANGTKVTVMHGRAFPHTN